MCQQGGRALNGVDTRWCASKDARPRRGVDWGVAHRLEKGMRVSVDARS